MGKISAAKIFFVGHELCQWNDLASASEGGENRFGESFIDFARSLSPRVSESGPCLEEMGEREKYPSERDKRRSWRPFA